MAWTGIAILCFITLHLTNFYFADYRRPLTDIVGSVLDNPLYSALYCAGLLALALHISHGFWSMFQSLGLNHPKYNGLIRTCRWIMCGGIVEILVRDALAREESCGCHLREESQTATHEARRDDKHFAHVAVWEYTGEGRAVMHKEPPELRAGYAFAAQLYIDHDGTNHHHYHKNLAAGRTRCPGQF